MVSFKILAGGYDAFIATYLFNSATSSLILQSKSPTGSSPSWISLSLTNRSILYAVNQVTGQGAVQSFAIEPNGDLTPAIDTVSSGGSRPAFVTALSTGPVAVVNYASGSGRIIPTTAHGAKFNPLANVITFPKPQGGKSHPHMVLEVQGSDEILIPDLGGDTIWRLNPETDSGEYSIHGSIPQPQSSGPRHIAIHNNRLFTLHELSSTLSVQTFPEDPNSSSMTFAVVSTTPPNPPDDAVWAAAEILIPPSSPKFPRSYIYVSNRNTGKQITEGDTIAIFEHVNAGQPDEGLELVKHVYTGLDQIRAMEFGNAEQGGDEFLVAAGYIEMGGVIVFRRTEEGRDLEILARTLRYQLGRALSGFNGFIHVITGAPRKGIYSYLSHSR
ncbi:Lactonase, 7-bladed beta-propeller-domain-containing protein [Gymnopilus junonius]|uniref:Lactonase, 7-bladed beta-propeller-domain-containing protein n=1 Tax=Gymnopilus junonius TaxID=109634 RepID=A0A9P5TRV8_GYMJU|nr:Lactonase, 7-bladed beta-propeller-domain-containing protein [Gymnopilus junonius]